MEWFDISEVLAKAPLSEVARRLGIETEKRGSQISALCPFHQDTKPSLRFYPADQVAVEHYHCFACGAHGHAIDLVKQVQGSEFLPAVQWLAKGFGIRSKKRLTAKQLERQYTVESARAFALRIFDEEHDSQKFQTWCDERFFDKKFLYAQGLRCISRSVLVEKLVESNTAEQIELIDGLLELGLIKRLKPTSNTDQLKLSLPDQFQDYFHDGRVLFPIYSADEKRPELAGFAGRTLANIPPEGVAKYLLSPGVQKAKYLFNARNAFAAARKELKDGDSTTLFLVEGFLDALRLQALGLNSVALMGTSLSDGQFELLKNFVEGLPKSKADFGLSIFLDNDKAGFSGADRLTRRLLGMAGVSLSWVGLDSRATVLQGKDPDTCLREIQSKDEALARLEPINRPAEAALLVAEMGGNDASDLADERWGVLNPSARERAVFKAATTIRQVRGSRPLAGIVQRLRGANESWASALCELLDSSSKLQWIRRSDLFLQGAEERLSQSRSLAYHGSRRGELPCDEETWLTLDVSARLFNRIAEERLTTQKWVQAAPYDAVYLPRKLTAKSSELDDPRCKVMPHPADLHLQQVLLNELLTQRHDLLSAEGKTFSEWIPAVRWFSGSRKVEVTGQDDELVGLDGEEPTLSFGYQLDMDVLEGSKPPSDQGMFRPYGQCWREFMGSLSRQCHAIGRRVHVLRLDAKRYYDSIQRYVVRDALGGALRKALAGSGVSVFGPLIGRADISSSEELSELLLDRVCDFLFGYQYRNPNTGVYEKSEAGIGIPQGPVLSAYIGTIALFPVDLVARRLMRKHVRQEPDGTTIPRIGYARYVDDIVVFAESEELLSDVRNELQLASSRLSISLINKGERVRSGTAIEVMRQLNEGRGLVASVPAWVPPFVGDGEAGWGLGGDMPIVDRQCALKMLRHPALLDQPERIKDEVKAAMQAADLRPNDLGLCARWLWWQVATEGHPQRGLNAVWERYWDLWRYVCGGHAWAEEFERRGYATLYAVEGLDKLLDASPWMEHEQSHIEVPAKRLIRIELAKLVFSQNFWQDLQPLENQAHIKRRIYLIASKARRLAGNLEDKLLIQPQETPAVSPVEWLCLAAELIRAYSAEAADDRLGTPPLVSIKGRSISGGTSSIASKVCETLMRADGRDKCTEDIAEDAVGVEAKELALDLVVGNASSRVKMSVLVKLSGLLQLNGDADQLTLVQRLPATSGSVLWAYGDPFEGKRRLYRFVSPPQSKVPGLPALPILVRVIASVGLNGEAAPAVEQMELHFSWENLVPQLTRETSCDLVSWGQVNWAAISELSSTKLAVHLFYAFVALQRTQVQNEDLVYVPFAPQLLGSGDPQKPLLHLIAEPLKREVLGVTAWYRDGDGRVRSVSVPHSGADLWRAGWAVADTLGLAADMVGEAGLHDEQLPDIPAISIERYLLRQQLRKLQGVYLSEAQTLHMDTRGLPRTVVRALQVLSEFDTHAADEHQVRYLLMVEAETRSMALRLQQRGGDGLRTLLHQVFPVVLNKLPLWTLESLILPAYSTEHQPLRPDFGLMLSLSKAMEEYWAQSSLAPLQAHRASLTLATVGVGLRGSIAALWGLTQALGTRRMPECLQLPVGWAMPDMVRTDPQADYKAMRQWLIDGDWPALCRASPWQLVLALLGLLSTGCPKALEQTELQKVFEILAAWQTQSSAEGVAEVWPYDGLPMLSSIQWTELVTALVKFVLWLDKSCGMRVVSQAAPRYRRDPNTDEFTDAKGQDWLLAKAQLTGLGAEDKVERRNNGGRFLHIWTETRRVSDDELLAVHTLDRKLGAWLANSNYSEAVDIDEGAKRVLPEAKIGAANLRVEEISAPDVEKPAKSPVPEQEQDRGFMLPAEENDSNVERENSFQLTVEDLIAAQKRSRTLRADTKSEAHFRVALFQWKLEDTYAHPLSEVGLRGLPLSKLAKDELRKMLIADGDLHAVDKAAERHEEQNWLNSIKVVSWPEHRRRKLIRKALDACKDLGVQMLVLPEVSVRPDTIAWLKDELKDFEDLAVLAGTYRNFSGDEHGKDHLRAPLNLLWRPKSEIAEAFGLKNDNITFVFERGKKYRAVAAKELFNPDWDELSPLYTEAELINQVVHELGKPGRISPLLDQLPALVHAVVHASPPLRYCMELICSELFLLTSPANYKPLEHELKMLQQRFSGTTVAAKEMVRADVEGLGEWLTVVQSKRERRSVLSVPAFTSRSNDYWHAGQASVLASGTATVFCNAAHKLSAGGSCFIGINSVSHSSESTGCVGTLTPYHGWQKGILQANSEGALSKDDQAVVVVDIDPVHVVSGKPRPQLLAEPMSLVAYLPIVEVLDNEKNAKGIAAALHNQFKPKAKKVIDALSIAKVTDPEKFKRVYTELLTQRNTDLRIEDGAKKLDEFSRFFSDSEAVCGRLLAWQDHRHQQPAFVAGGLGLEPAWLDFLVVDLTCTGSIPKVQVPRWTADKE